MYPQQIKIKNKYGLNIYLICQMIKKSEKGDMQSQYAPTIRKSRGVRTQTKIIQNEVHQLVRSQNISNLLLTYLKYKIIMDISYKSRAELIIKKMKINTQGFLQFQQKSGWTQRYFQQDQSQKLNLEIFEKDFDTFYVQTLKIKNHKFNKFESKKSKHQVKSHTLLLLQAEANGVSYNKFFLKKIFKKFFVPSSGLGIHTTYSNISSVQCVVFDETSFFVKYCRWMSAFLNQEQFSYPTPDGMPTWLSQDIDIVNNLLVIQGTPSEEDINQEYLLRVSDNKDYLIRQYVMQVVSPIVSQDQLQDKRLETDQDQFNVKLLSDSYINNTDKVKKGIYQKQISEIDYKQNDGTVRKPSNLSPQKKKQQSKSTQFFKDNNSQEEKDYQEIARSHAISHKNIQQKQNTVEEEDYKYNQNQEEDDDDYNPQQESERENNRNMSSASADIKQTDNSDAIKYDLTYMVSDIRQEQNNPNEQSWQKTFQKEISGYQVNTKNFISFTAQEENNVVLNNESKKSSFQDKTNKNSNHNDETKAYQESAEGQDYKDKESQRQLNQSDSDKHLTGGNDEEIQDFPQTMKSQNDLKVINVSIQEQNNKK